LLLTLFAHVLGASLSEAEPAKVTGKWKVEITFDSGNVRQLRFEAQESGKGSFLLLDPRLKVWGPAKPTEAKWSQADDGSVTFSGPVEFPLGNVGRDAGTLMLKGKFEADGLITGRASLLPEGQDPKDPEIRTSKEGSFKATRGAGE